MIHPNMISALSDSRKLIPMLAMIHSQFPLTMNAVFNNIRRDGTIVIDVPSLPSSNAVYIPGPRVLAFLLPRSTASSRNVHW